MNGWKNINKTRQPLGAVRFDSGRGPCDMADYKTLRVPESAYDQAKADKREAETWGDFLSRCAETPPEIREFVEADTNGSVEGVSNQVDEDAIARAVSEQFDYAMLAEQVAERVLREVQG